MRTLKCLTKLYDKFYNEGISSNYYYGEAYHQSGIPAGVKKMEGKTDEGGN